MAKLIIIRGYPGSGKTTIGKLLQENGHGIFIDHNSILTFLANIVGDDRGIYEDIHELELSMTNKLLLENKSVIVARGFGANKSIQPYLELATNNNIESTIIRLDAKKDILEERVAAPERKIDFNPTIDAETLNAWINNNPMQDLAVEHIIDASEELNKVLASVEGKL